MEFPVCENSDNLWSQIYTRSSPLPGDQNGDRVLHENGFPVASGTESRQQNLCSVCYSVWNAAVCCVRTVVENTADCQQASCSFLRSRSLAIPRRVYGTQSAHSTQLERQPSQHDRFAGASAPPRPDMERSMNSNSDSPPYMPSGNQKIFAAASSIEIVAEPPDGISSQNGRSSQHGASEYKRGRKYLRQSQPNFRDLAV